MTERFAFPVAEVRRANDCATKLARFGYGDIPEDLILDPTPVLASFGCLQVKPGWRLSAYLSEGPNHQSTVVALAESDSAAHEPPSASDDGEPYPGAHFDIHLDLEVLLKCRPRFMTVVEGDGSPWSYLCASLAVRQLIDFAAFWHARYRHDWFEHVVVAEWPGEFAESYIRFSTPQDLRAPEVEIDGGAVTTRFYTYRPPTFVDEEVWRHEDRYEAGSYEPLMRRALVASGRRATRCY